MSHKNLLGKLRRAGREIDQAAAELAKEEGSDAAVQASKDKDITIAQARLRALEFRVDAMKGRA